MHQQQLPITYQKGWLGALPMDWDLKGDAHNRKPWKLSTLNVNSITSDKQVSNVIQELH